MPDRLMEWIQGIRPMLAMLWLGLAGLGVALLVLMYTRWGRFNALGKCLVLSAVAHLVLAGYSMTIYVAGPAPASPREIRVLLVDEPPPAVAAPSPNVGPPPQAMALAEPAPTPPPPSPRTQPAKPEANLPTRSAWEPVRSSPCPIPDLSHRASVTATWAGQHQDHIPDLYRFRMSPERNQIARQFGADPKLEASVQAALRWLAENQEADGRWNASRHGGGLETQEAGRDRHGAGSRADTAVTGLALLSLTACGQTHLSGDHSLTVRRGAEFLLAVQGADGNLGGDGTTYEFMYCHGMATLALSELLGMTGDQRLMAPVQRAIGYTVAAQDPQGGGWRYQPREPGDTSQLGWQLMALKSAELGGVTVPADAWQGARRFLESVSAGAQGGLASYRPGERPTCTMTAEALFCRQFLGLTPDCPTSWEASEFVLGNLPGEGPPNLYYWYYGTMAMYQLQGRPWAQWSQALQRTLMASQQRTGPFAGSWDPVTRWDSYGGRVYSTALATLCLESFYRFVPLYARVPLQADLSPPEQPRR